MAREYIATEPETPKQERLLKGCQPRLASCEVTPFGAMLVWCLSPISQQNYATLSDVSMVSEPHQSAELRHFERC